MEKNRLEAFSDGVLAIVITIMVLELKQPLGDGWSDLLALKPILLSYLLSFVFIAIYWVHHHMIFQRAERVNIRILWCNIVWLFVMSFIPFTTTWIGTYPQSNVPVFLYFFDMLLACLAFNLMNYLIAVENGRKEEFRFSPQIIGSSIGYLLAVILGSFCPTAAYIVVVIVTCWRLVPRMKQRINSR